jgi:hypothetical protein
MIGFDAYLKQSPLSLVVSRSTVQKQWVRSSANSSHRHGRLRAASKGVEGLRQTSPSRVSNVTVAAILGMNRFSTRFFAQPREALVAARLEAPDLLMADVAMEQKPARSSHSTRANITC